MSLDTYWHKAGQASGSLPATLASDAGLAFVTIVPGALLARAGGAASVMVERAGGSDAAAKLARDAVEALGRGRLGLFNRSMGEIPGVGLAVAQYAASC